VLANPTEGWAQPRAWISSGESGVRLHLRGAMRVGRAKFSTRHFGCCRYSDIGRVRSMGGGRLHARRLCVADDDAGPGQFPIRFHLEDIRMKWLKWIGIV